MPDFSGEFLDHFRSPRNAGALPNPDGQGIAGTPGEGHFIVIYIKVENRTITEASFKTFGCPAAIACGSFVTERVKGQCIDEALTFGEKEVIAGLGGLPLGKRHNAGLAMAALRAAIEVFIRK